ncbi:RpiB/LacA/LacB family sugar-phosphate isomerase [Olsenella uli]|uniref:RpiB/LacA/LacB family sugar-phosphate isomerase n=1 Tax=Olsenella uli TaxID=133926 RepID=UPI000452D95E|nr:RpiB/LacA/LacB family sugar-phosphate isomerase [Olsenella uli]EUB30710.1 ribose/galactose isomerase domain protein [Olsenella uli MSTE5]
MAQGRNSSQHASAERFNYPIGGYRVAQMVAPGGADGGALICGTDVGISLAANKVRASVPWCARGPTPPASAASTATLTS